METDWKRIDGESARLYEKEMEDAKKSSSADRAFFTAAQSARRSAIQNDILPARTQDGDFEYTLQQGLRAACHAREDVTATLILQRDLLRRLDRNRNLLWAVVALLLYVAYRLS